MDAAPRISQRDLRMRSREIMDSIERGQVYTVTRDGHEIAEIVPLRRGRRFVSRADFAEASRRFPTIDLAAVRADLDAAADPDVTDRYAR